MRARQQFCPVVAVQAGMRCRFVGLCWDAAGVARSTGLDQAALSATLRSQHSVIARRQAIACGITSDALAHRLRPDGPWQRLLPRTYLAVTGSPTLDQKEMAALLYSGQGSVLTGVAALRQAGIVSSAPSVLDVLVPAKRQIRSIAFVAVHRTTRMPGQVIVVGRRQYAMKPRAVADAAREMSELGQVRELVAAVVQDGRCPIEMLVHELGRGPVKGSALLRQVLAEVAEGVRSVAEGDFLDLIKRGRLPVPLLNARLFSADGLFIARPDAWWPQAGVAAEVDSREWHLKPADWERTMDRHARMSSHGIIVLHFTPRRIRTAPAQVTTTIADALTAGSARRPLAVVTRRA